MALVPALDANASRPLLHAIGSSTFARQTIAFTGSLAIAAALTVSQLTFAPMATAAAGCSTTTPAIGVTVTCTTAGSETITVPAGATTVELTVKGGGGGGGGKGGAGSLSAGGVGGSGALIQGTIPISGLTSLGIEVGSGGNGGRPPGSGSSQRGGVGGGSSSITSSGPSYIVVAGGGGGGGVENGGFNGGNGGSGGQAGVTGGGLGGGGGNSSGTGNGGSGAGDGGPGTDGFTGVGGTRAFPYSGNGGAGYGGGGAGGYASGIFGGGGGGGSYLTPTATLATFTTGGGGAGGTGASVNTSPGTDGSAGSITLTFFAPPDAPTGVAATAESGHAIVSWTAPASTGGSVVSSYTVTSNPGSLAFTAAGTATSLTATGLTNGTAYTFTVTATNIAGTSSQSSPSNVVTPATPPEPVPIPASTESQLPQVNLESSISTVPPAAVPPPLLIVGHSSALVGGESVAVTSTPLAGGGILMGVAGAVLNAAPKGDGESNPSQETTGAPQSESTNGYRPGGEVDVYITGLAPESRVSAYLYSQPTFLGTLDVDSRGEVIGFLLIPSSVPVGNHTLQFTGWLPTGDALVVSTMISLTNVSQSMTRSVFFDYGATALRHSAKKKLAALVGHVSTWTDSRSIVVGYQRALGASKTDIDRARARAYNVARYLRAIGMPGVISVAKNQKTGSSDHTARRVKVTVNSF